MRNRNISSLGGIVEMLPQVFAQGKANQGALIGIEAGGCGLDGAFGIGADANSEEFGAVVSCGYRSVHSVVILYHIVATAKFF